MMDALRQEGLSAGQNQTQATTRALRKLEKRRCDQGTIGEERGKVQLPVSSGTVSSQVKPAKNALSDLTLVLHDVQRPT